MRRTSIIILYLGASLAVTAAGCAAGSTDGDVGPNTPSSSSDGNASLPMPSDGDTGFDPPKKSASSSSSSSGSSSGASGSTSSSSSSSSTSSSGGSSSGTSSTSSSSSSSSGSSGSSSGSTTSSTSSSGGSGGACGVCDRNWTCNGFTDPWATTGVDCVNTRTSTALKCNGKFDQGGSVNVGTWTSSASAQTLTLNYPMLGGGTKTYVCTP